MSVSGSGKTPHGYGDFDPSKVKNDPALAKKLKEGMDLIRSSKNFKVDKEVGNIKEKYFSEPEPTEPPKVKIKKGFKQMQEVENYDGIRSSKAIPDPPTRIPPNPKASLPPSKGLPEIPKVAEQVFTRTKKSGQTGAINQQELVNNPLTQKFRKQAEYGGEIKLSKAEAKEQKEFADKAERFGYRFDSDFEMYLPIVEGSKEALTKDEMAQLIDGKIPSLQRREVKHEKIEEDLMKFASNLFYKFDEDSQMFVANNPFVAEKNLTIDEMKEKLASSLDKEKIDKVAKSQGYTPIQGMDGLYQNEDGDIRTAEDFR